MVDNGLAVVAVVVVDNDGVNAKDVCSNNAITVVTVKMRNKEDGDGISSKENIDFIDFIVFIAFVLVVKYM